ncbi:hypothetical protein ACLOJK_013390 [Asimina triloba]
MGAVAIWIYCRRSTDPEGDEVARCCWRRWAKMSSGRWRWKEEAIAVAGFQSPDLEGATITTVAKDEDVSPASVTATMSENEEKGGGPLEELAAGSHEEDNGALNLVFRRCTEQRQMGPAHHAILAVHVHPIEQRRQRCTKDVIRQALDIGFETSVREISCLVQILAGSWASNHEATKAFDYPPLGNGYEGDRFFPLFIPHHPKMKSFPLLWMLSSALLLLSAISIHGDLLYESSENGVTTSVYLSPPFFLGPGTVRHKFYYDVDFPKGHFAIKSFNAEIVDEDGNPIPLTETYLHHWIIYRYYGRTSTVDPYVTDTLNLTNIIPVWNSGPCQGTIVRQTYGVGSETRRTLTDVPDPYAVEAGNPAEIPEGYEHRWILNVHAIDTRHVVDRMGCAECRCHLYNITKDAHGKPYAKGAGGSFCCPDHTQCLLREGVENVGKRRVYMRYTVKWVEWNDNIVPVKVYIFDVTDTGKRSPVDDTVGCQAEYSIEACSASDREKGRCVHTQKGTVKFPRGGNVVYAVGHQHWGGVGIALYGQDGRVICKSMPIYGNGTEVGNEDGYLVGMTACYPKPGSVAIRTGEVMNAVAKYENSRSHTGIMGHFYVLLEETPSAIASSSEFPDNISEDTMSLKANTSDTMSLEAARTVITLNRWATWARWLQRHDR